MKVILKDIGRYKICQELGQGSFGKVYKAIDQTDHTQVALKFITKKGKSKKDLLGLISENEILKKICHDNIIRLIDLIETDHEMIIVTDYAGEDLARLLKKNKKFSHHQVQNYSRQIFSALLYLNQNKITHRDLKPANILIKDGAVKLCDFGFARKLSASTNFMNSLKGTPLYIAPEILNGREYNHKVDIWSFGIIIYELFQGITPFHAETLHTLKPKILHQNVKFPKDMPVDMKTLIGGMLQKNPTNRFDWSDLKQNQFFIPSKVDHQQPEQKQQSIMKAIENLEKKNSSIEEQKKNSQHDNTVHFLKGLCDIEEISKIEENLKQNKLDGKQLRTGTNNQIDLYQKIMAILSSYCVGEKIVRKQILKKIFSILNFLIKKVKISSTDEMSQKDIMKKKQLLLCFIKIADNELDAQYLEEEIMIIGFLIKINFNNLSVDYDIDQDITDLCVKELNRKVKYGKCFQNSLKVLGILGNQGIMTLGHSEDFFIRVEEQQIVSAIARNFTEVLQMTNKKNMLKIFLECLQIFIHPNISMKTEQNNQQMLKVFKSIREQTAKVLFQKQFHNFKDSLLILEDQNSMKSYMMVMYECIKNCKQFRKQISESTYWSELIEKKQLRTFIMAFDFICYQEEGVTIVPKMFYYHIEVASNIEKALMLSRAGYELSLKKSQNERINPSKQLIFQLSELLLQSQEQKTKASEYLEGYLSFGSRIFEQIIGYTFFTVFDNNKILKNQIDQSLILIIVQKLFDVRITGKLRISSHLTANIIIMLQDMCENGKNTFLTNTKFFTIITSLFSYFLIHSTFFHLSEEQNPQLCHKFFISIFTFLKYYGTIDEKEQCNLYYKAQAKGINSLLLSEKHINKQTIKIVISILLKISSLDPKNNQQIIDFIGINLLVKIKTFIRGFILEESQDFIIQVLQILNLVVKNSKEFDGRVRDLDIIRTIPKLLNSNKQSLKHYALMFIGYLSKNSKYFFEDFEKFRIFETIKKSMRMYQMNEVPQKIAKGLVYAIGNVSFYSDQFKTDIQQLIPILSECLNKSEDPRSIENTISTVINLLRHSNYYVAMLCQHKVMQKIIQIVLQPSSSSEIKQRGLNALNKLLNYKQCIGEFIRKEQFEKIYKMRLGGKNNECMKKIAEMLK